MPYRKLGRPTAQRQALFRAAVTSLLAHERIETTEAKAKEIRSQAERMITLAKRGDLAARRRAAAFILDEDVAKKLFDTLGPRYRERNGGYTRILKLGPRRGDAATMALIELV